MLERAHRAGDVGPKAYARERGKIIDMVADTLDGAEKKHAYR